MRYWICASIVVVVTGASAALLAQDPLDSELHQCQRTCAEVRRAQANECLDRTGARNDSSQRPAFDECMRIPEASDKRCLLQCRQPPPE